MPEVGENQTLSIWLDSHARTQPDAVALSDATGEMTYGDLANQVAQLSAGLASIGIHKGDIVAAQLPNVRAFVITLLATNARGAIFQTLHMPYRSNELRGLLADSGAKAVVVTHAETDSRANDVLSIRDELPNLEHIIVAGDAPEGSIPLDQLHSKEAEGPVETASEDPFLLLYTSGTTASPKGVPHTSRSFLNNALHAAREMQINRESRILSLAPMSHLYGLFTLQLALASGATAALVPAFNPRTVLDDLAKAKATHVFSAPAHFAPFASQEMLAPQHFQSVKLLCLSGSAVPPSLAETIDGLMENGVVTQLWGMSELQAGTFGRPDDPEETRFTTAGRPSFQTQLRVVDAEGNALPSGQEGELQMQGPSLFSAYLNKPAETKAAFDGHWFATGDLAILDENGFLKITGRTKEIINRGGVKFNPIEVEEILLQIKGIQECAIVAVPDPDLGERGCLCVTLTPGAGLTLEEVTDLLENAGIAKYKWPERLEVLDALPMTPTRKVMRKVLSEIVKKEEQ